MKECPRCFWLTQHKVWKRPSGIFPSLPSGMDRILKIHFDKFRDKGKLPPEICENGHCENMKLFDDKEKMKIWQSNFKGVSWIDKATNQFSLKIPKAISLKSQLKKEKEFVFVFNPKKEETKEKIDKSKLVIYLKDGD